MNDDDVASQNYTDGADMNSGSDSYSQNSGSSLLSDYNSHGSQVYQPELARVPDQASWFDANSPETEEDPEAGDPLNANEYGEFTLPNGYQVDNDVLDEFRAFGREANLTPAQAQNIIDLQVKLTQRQMDNYIQQTQTWHDSMVNDPVYGKSKLDQTLGYANLPLKRFDKDGELRQMLTNSGYGSHPVVIKFLSQLGKEYMAEDRVVSGRGQPMGKKIPLHQALWPDD